MAYDLQEKWVYFVVLVNTGNIYLYGVYIYVSHAHKLITHITLALRN